MLTCIKIIQQSFNSPIMFAEFHYLIDFSETNEYTWRTILAAEILSKFLLYEEL